MAYLVIVGLIYEEFWKQLKQTTAESGGDQLQCK